jgi:hypothetical protein
LVFHGAHGANTIEVDYRMNSAANGM